MYINLDLNDPAWGKQAIASIEKIAVDYKEEIDGCIKNGTLPYESFRALGKAGLMGVVTPEILGGYGGSAPEYCLVTEAIARHGLPSPQAQVQIPIGLI